jgi:hypothetical protein
MRTAATKAWLTKGKDLESNETADPRQEHLTQENLASKRPQEEDLAHVATKKLEVGVVHGYSVLTGEMVAAMPPPTVVGENGKLGDIGACGVTDYHMMFP